MWGYQSQGWGWKKVKKATCASQNYKWHSWFFCLIPHSQSISKSVSPTKACPEVISVYLHYHLTFTITLAKPLPLLPSKPDALQLGFLHLLYLLSNSLEDREIFYNYKLDHISSVLKSLYQFFLVPRINSSSLLSLISPLTVVPALLLSLLTPLPSMVIVLQPHRRTFQAKYFDASGPLLLQLSLPWILYLTSSPGSTFMLEVTAQMLPPVRGLRWLPCLKQ